LRVADSKYIKFSRSADGVEMSQRSDDDRDYRVLAPESLIYFSIHNENQNPYGTPLLRSCEFASKVLVTIQNATLNVWERFGDPSFNIVYKTSKKDGADHVTRRAQIETEFNTAIRAKREGKSADFIRAIDKDSEISIQVIGHDNQILEMEIPARHVLEQIVAKTGLPPWMLGLHWSTTERLSNAEAEMLLADVATRQAAKMPMFTNLVAAMLTRRGRRWKKGDWQLNWANVNLHDVVANAQARFLNAQADMYYLQNAAAAGIEISREDLSIGKSIKTPYIVPLRAPGTTIHGGKGGNGGCKELIRSFPWPELDRVEQGYEKRLKDDWAELLIRFKVTLKLGLPPIKDAGDPGSEGFEITAEQESALKQALKVMIAAYAITAEDSPVNWFYGQSVSLGFIRAAQMLGQPRSLLSLLKNSLIYDKLRAAGFEMVKENATRAIIDKIIPELRAYMLAGANPVSAARRLEQLFGAANSNWERLARSEMALAAELAKQAEWKEWGVEWMAFAPAPDACGLCLSLTGEYEIDACPVPVRDTHPRCRCSTRPLKQRPA
jgi:hypothetical protein